MIDLNKTKEFYINSEYKEDNIVCLNYLKQVKNVYPDLCKSLEEMGIDALKPFELYYYPGEDKTIDYFIQYQVFGDVCQEDVDNLPGDCSVSENEDVLVIEINRLNLNWNDNHSYNEVIRGDKAIRFWESNKILKVAIIKMILSLIGLGSLAYIFGVVIKNSFALLFVGICIVPFLIFGFLQLLSSIKIKKFEKEYLSEKKMSVEEAVKICDATELDKYMFNYSVKLDDFVMILSIVLKDDGYFVQIGAEPKDHFSYQKRAEDCYLLYTNLVMNPNINKCLDYFNKVKNDYFKDENSFDIHHKDIEDDGFNKNI